MFGRVYVGSCCRGCQRTQTKHVPFVLVLRAVQVVEQRCGELRRDFTSTADMLAADLSRLAKDGASLREDVCSIAGEVCSAALCTCETVCVYLLQICRSVSLCMHASLSALSGQS